MNQNLYRQVLPLNLALLLLGLSSAGVASATTFTRDPEADSWTLIGNSKTQWTPTFGGWAGGSLTADFNIYSTRFTLSNTDTVSGTIGQAAGDAFLASSGAKAGGVPTTFNSSTVQTNPGTGWLANDQIIGVGVKWINGQKGNGVTFNNNSKLTVTLDPTGASTFTGGSRATNTPGNTDFTSYSSSGSFTFEFFNTADNVQNRNPYTTYSINNSSSIQAPYGVVGANSNNRSTIGYGDANPEHTPSGDLPVRSFSNYNFTSGEWEYAQFFINESLMLRNSYGALPFTNSAKWVVGTIGTQPFSALASGGLFAEVPGPLPILGVGSAFAWSRRLRVRLKDKFVSPGR